MGVATVSHDQEYGTLVCKGCKREFILLSVHRSVDESYSVVEQPEYDYCPYCGKKR